MTCHFDFDLGFGFLLGCFTVGSIWFCTELARHWTRDVPKDDE